MKVGIRAVRRRRHMLDEEELRALKVQVMPALPRILLVTFGALALIGAFCGWPWDSSERQFLEGLLGAGSLSFGLFGVRRTLGAVLDSVSTVDVLGLIAQAIGDAIDS